MSRWFTPPKEICGPASFITRTTTVENNVLLESKNSRWSLSSFSRLSLIHTLSYVVSEPLTEANQSKTLDAKLNRLYKFFTGFLFQTHRSATFSSDRCEQSISLPKNSKRSVHQTVLQPSIPNHEITCPKYDITPLTGVSTLRLGTSTESHFVHQV